MYLWPLLRRAGPNSTATSMDRQQTAAFFQKQTVPPIDINSVSAILQYFFQTSEGWLVINPFRKMTPSYYSWQGLNNRCFGEPRTLEGIGTVQPLSGWSVCCYTMAEWGEGGREQQHSSAAERQTAGSHVKSFSCFGRLINHCFVLFVVFLVVLSDVGKPAERVQRLVRVYWREWADQRLTCQAGCRESFIVLETQR